MARPPLVVFISTRALALPARLSVKSPLTVVPAKEPENGPPNDQCASPLTVSRDTAGLSTPVAATSPLTVLTDSVPETSPISASPLTVST